ncbi:hypothetical protein [Aridibaculum aurantiacum]|uniref:hypothetical protein n=1 Tax=Aridibaculum aurantiacum TaxID=2810307 RepID=UPI001A96F837|nr:hypothetical protein [Aridibaculum aurantiacum]
MLDNLIMFLLTVNSYLPIIICTIFFAKASLFVWNMKKTWKPYHLVYFQYQHIILSRSVRSYNQKKIQNNLTLWIAALAIMHLVLQVVSSSLHLHP